MGATGDRSGGEWTATEGRASPRLPSSATLTWCCRGSGGLLPPLTLPRLASTLAHRSTRCPSLSGRSSTRQTSSNSQSPAAPPYTYSASPTTVAVWLHRADGRARAVCGPVSLVVSGTERSVIAPLFASPEAPSSSMAVSVTCLVFIAACMST